MIHVSFQGERGAYSEAAARSFFNKQIETIPQTTFAEVLENTSNGKTQYSSFTSREFFGRKCW